MLYGLLVLVHIIGVLGFVATHGVSMVIGFKVRKEGDPKTVALLIALSRSTFNYMYAFTLILLAGGISAGFVGHLWGTGWMWTALVLLVLIFGYMSAVPAPFYGKLRQAAEIESSGGSPIPGQDLVSLRVSKIPTVTSVIGIVGLALIAWLMVMKPY
ncbi:MAG: DUF2269 family protein [Actinomycetota bacterium]